jgi:putative spermidine/putrescine transport system ATP-binding protein
VSATVEVAGATVEFGRHRALDRVDLRVEAGKFVTLLGPSGSGKTTTLNAIAGFVPLAAGDVLVGGDSIARLSPSRRDLGIVFQSYALFPHMTVGDNVGFPLRARKVPRAERRRRVGRALELVQLEGYGDRKPATLSGGQQQRVALARAIVYEPKVLLLDEPLAALDKQLRESMQLELKRLQRSVGITTVAVTHDQTEAMALSDRVAIMRDGRIEQVATPTEAYGAPATRFVAAFLGEANLLPPHTPLVAGAPRTASSASVGAALVRPEQIVLNAGGDRRATVQEAVFQGERWRLVVEHDGLRLIVSRPSTAPPLAAGDAVALTVTGEVHVVPADGQDRSTEDESALSASRGVVVGR